MIVDRKSRQKNSKQLVKKGAVGDESGEKHRNKGTSKKKRKDPQARPNKVAGAPRGKERKKKKSNDLSLGTRNSRRTGKNKVSDEKQRDKASPMHRTKGKK